MSLSLLLVSMAAVVVAPRQGRCADPEPTSAVDPDRPSVSTTARTVPPGAWQIETGVAYERESVAGGPAVRRLSMETVVRVGVVKGLEARIEGEPVVRLRGGEDDTGSGDVTLGLKWHVLDAAGLMPGIGFQPFVKLPVARAPVGTEKVDAGLRALFSFELPAQWSLDVNGALAAIGQSRPSGYLVQGLASASLDHPITERLSAFVEVFFASRDERGRRHNIGADAGLAFAVARHLVLDAAILTSMTGQGPDYALRAGLSARFGK